MGNVVAVASKNIRMVLATAVVAMLVVAALITAPLELKVIVLMPVMVLMLMLLIRFTLLTLQEITGFRRWYVQSNSVEKRMCFRTKWLQNPPRNKTSKCSQNISKDPPRSPKPIGNSGRLTKITKQTPNLNGSYCAVTLQQVMTMTLNQA
jgi:hypothetical protein